MISTLPKTNCPTTLDHAKAVAPPPASARMMSRAVEGTKLMALARKILSCLKSLISWAFGTANTPVKRTDIARPRIGPTATAEPSEAATGLAKATIAPASIALDPSAMAATVGARLSISRSARNKQDETPTSAMLLTMMYAVKATAKTPKSGTERICATTAVSKTFARRSKRLLATTQRAPLRTLAESERESLATAEGPETSLRGGSDVLVMPNRVSRAGTRSLPPLRPRRRATTPPDTVPPKYR